MRRKQQGKLSAPNTRFRSGPFGSGSGDGASGNERFGRWTEAIARGMGTPWFLLALSLFSVAWLVWNTWGPEEKRFDSAAIGFTALTLILSLQASYAAPMILLAQNRQDDRDRVQMEQDRQRAERTLADTEYLAREIVALRFAISDLPDKDHLRQELRGLLEEVLREDRHQPENSPERSPETPPAAAGPANSLATPPQEPQSPAQPPTEEPPRV